VPIEKKSIPVQPEIKPALIEEKSTPVQPEIKPALIKEKSAPVQPEIKPALIEEKSAPEKNRPVQPKYPLTQAIPVSPIKERTEPQEPLKTYEPVLTRERDIIIALDAGHGGIDPGAIGQAGIQEKDIVLAIAENLAVLLKQEPDIRPVLVRKGDYFLPLRKRVELARKYKADLLISIHADAYPDKTANGSSVYMLSRRGASSEAVKWLAERENNADLIGGISLNDKDDLLASVLLDLSQTSTLTASAHVGQQVLNSLKKSE
jgi:N-acetylmuramoyl-L-alanine amidase